MTRISSFNRLVFALLPASAVGIVFELFLGHRHEVTNPFTVTEVYVQQDGVRKFASLSFTRLITPGESH